MFANFLIGLREGLEAALVVGILIAYVVAIGRRDLAARLWLGVGLAVALSLGVGAVLTFGSYGLSSQAEETIAGTLSIVATGLVTWMIFWLARSAKGLSHDLRSSVDARIAGPGWGLVFVAFVAVAREGVETALFIWAAVKASGSEALPLLGAAIGLACAVGLGYLIYRGVLKINLSVFFAYTGVFLILVAAGVLSYGVHDLQEAGVLPGIRALAFDVSAAIPPDSWYGTLLKGVFNFSPATTWLELIVWIAYVVPVMTIFMLTIRRNSTAQRAARTVASPTAAPNGG